MLLRERTRSQRNTASESWLKLSNACKGHKIKLPITSVKARTLTLKDQVLHHPSGSEEGRQPTRIMLDPADPTVEIQVTQPNKDLLNLLMKTTCLLSDSTWPDEATEDTKLWNDDLLPKGMSLQLRVYGTEPIDDLPIAVNCMSNMN